MSATHDKEIWEYPYPLFIIPNWCRMPLDIHQDGDGGCWGISTGEVEKHGEKWCKSCHLYYQEEVYYRLADDKK